MVINLHDSRPRAQFVLYTLIKTIRGKYNEISLSRFPSLICFVHRSGTYRDETAPVAVGSTLAVVVLCSITAYGIWRYVFVLRVSGVGFGGAVYLIYEPSTRNCLLFVYADTTK